MVKKATNDVIYEEIIECIVGQTNYSYFNFSSIDFTQYRNVSITLIPLEGTENSDAVLQFNGLIHYEINFSSSSMEISKNGNGFSFFPLCPLEMNLNTVIGRESSDGSDIFYMNLILMPSKLYSGVRIITTSNFPSVFSGVMGKIDKLYIYSANKKYIKLKALVTGYKIS